MWWMTKTAMRGSCLPTTPACASAASPSRDGTAIYVGALIEEVTRSARPCGQSIFRLTGDILSVGRHRRRTDFVTT